MARFNDLPPELLPLITKHLDHPSLKQSQLVCRSLLPSATASLFELINRFPCPQMCYCIGEILAREHLRRCVQEITLFAHEPEELDEDTGVALSPHCIEFINRFKEFPCLREIYIELDSYDIEREDADLPAASDYRKGALNFILSRLASMDRPIDDLFLGAVLWEDKSFIKNVTKVISSLRRDFFCIRKHDLIEEVSGDMETFPTLYSKIPQTWLAPGTSRLQNLALIGHHLFGFYPKFDLDTIHFPHLQVLRLIDYSFGHDSQLDWILSHKETLTEVYLESCTIISKVQMKENKQHLCAVPPKGLKMGPSGKYCSYAYSKRWSDYFAILQHGLPHLRHFDYEMRGPRPSSPDFQRRAKLACVYLSVTARDLEGPGPNIGPTSYHRTPRGGNEDVDACVPCSSISNSTEDYLV